MTRRRCTRIGAVVLWAATVCAVDLVAADAMTGQAASGDAVPAAQARRTDAGGAEGRTDSFENTPLSFPANPQAPLRPSARAGSIPSIFSVLLYVFLFCVLFTAGIWLVKRYLPGHRQFFAHPALEVLGRTHLDQRRYVSLLRVGARILVVGVTPDAITPLSEVTDGKEVAEIMIQARPGTESGKTLFQKIFQRHIVEADNAAAREDLDNRAESLAEDVSSLRSRIRSRRTEEAAPGGIDRLG